MRRDSRLSGVLHVLIHMLQADPSVATTSEKLAETMETNPVVIRRVFAGLRKAGLVTSEKGHGGGWRIACDPARVTLAQIYEAVGSPAVLAMGHRTESPGCLIEQSVNAALGNAFREAEATVMARLNDVTLAELAADFGKRYRRKRSKKEKHNEA